MEQIGIPNLFHIYSFLEFHEGINMEQIWNTKFLPWNSVVIRVMKWLK